MCPHPHVAPLARVRARVRCLRDACCVGVEPIPRWSSFEARCCSANCRCRAAVLVHAHAWVLSLDLSRRRPDRALLERSLGCILPSTPPCGKSFDRSVSLLDKSSSAASPALGLLVAAPSPPGRALWYLLERHFVQLGPGPSLPSADVLAFMCRRGRDPSLARAALRRTLTTLPRFGGRQGSVRPH